MIHIVLVKCQMGKYYNVEIDLFLTEVVKNGLNHFSQLQIIYSINKKKLLINAILGVMVS